MNEEESVLANDAARAAFMNRMNRKSGGDGSANQANEIPIGPGENTERAVFMRRFQIRDDEEPVRERTLEL